MSLIKPLQHRSLLPIPGAGAAKRNKLPIPQKTEFGRFPATGLPGLKAHPVSQMELAGSRTGIFIIITEKANVLFRRNTPGRQMFLRNFHELSHLLFCERFFMDKGQGQEWTQWTSWTQMDAFFMDINGHVQQVMFFLSLSIRPSNGKSIASIPSMMSIRVPVH
jgi:hypothetical protein